MRLFITEFMEGLRESEIRNSTLQGQNSGFSIATGVAACKYLTNILKIASEKYGRMRGRVYAIRNDFFGESITVAGLITGSDIIAQLKDKELGSKLLIPQNMLRHGENVFLDDVTVPDVAGALGVPVEVVGQHGVSLLNAIIALERNGIK